MLVIGPREVVEGLRELAGLPRWVGALLVVAMVCVLVALSTSAPPPGGGVVLTP